MYVPFVPGDVMQMYWPAVRLSQSPMTYGFHFMNWARVVLPPTAVARLELCSRLCQTLAVIQRAPGAELTMYHRS